MGRILTEPTLKDVLDMMKKDILLSTNCHAIAKVQTFNPLLQTITATINYKKTVMKKNALGQYKPKSMEYCLLTDCPVFIFRGGNASLTMPIKAGDSCLICFNDRDMDNWLSTGQVREPNSNRLHSFSDAIALVGLSPLTNPILNYDTDRPSLRNGTTKLAVGSSKVEISNALYTLNSLLQELITEISDLATQAALINVPAFGSPPANAPAITAIGVRVAATAVKIGGLLE